MASRATRADSGEPVHRRSDAPAPRPGQRVAPLRVAGDNVASAHTVLGLQSAAGNGSVATLVQRSPGTGRVLTVQRDPKTTPPPPPPLPQTTPPTVTADPLADTRIAWIRDLPSPIQYQIDGVGDAAGVMHQREGQAAKATKELADAKARLDAAIAAAAKAPPPAPAPPPTTTPTAPATKAPAKSAKKPPPTPQEAYDAALAHKQQVDAVITDNERKHASGWAKNRIALMDYMQCSLGSDQGTERYFKSLVPFGQRWGLYVHPELARRFALVREELKKQNVPWPETDVGLGLRGDHIHPDTQHMAPGMMIHFLGVAVDWQAYKNVHLRDDNRLKVLIEAVTGGPHNLQLGWDGLATIVAAGEKRMGKPLDAKQAKAAEREEAVIEKIGTEYDRLKTASDELRDSITFDKKDLLELHGKLVGPAAKVIGLREKLKYAPKNETIKAALKTAQDELDALEAQLRPDLERLFKPWLDKIKLKTKEVEAQAAAMGVSDLAQVTSDNTLKSMTSSAGAAIQPYWSAIAQAWRSAGKAAGDARDLRNKVLDAKAYLDKSGTDDERTTLSPKLADLDTRTAAIAARGVAVGNEAQLLHGDDLTTGPAAAKQTPRKAKWDTDLAVWDASVPKVDGKMADAEKAMAAAKAKVPAEVLDDAKKLLAVKQSNEKVRKAMKDPKQFGDVQAMKVKWFLLDQAAKGLLEDATFMFRKPDVVDPGVAQIAGALSEGYGGGGFFGTTKSGEDATAAGKPNDESGFGRLFFQWMARYGIEPAAWWETSDTMHFQIRSLVDQIVPVRACAEPAADAEEENLLDFAELARIAAARAEAANNRAKGEAFVKTAEDAHGEWAKEGSQH